MDDRPGTPRVLLDTPITFEAGHDRVHTPMVRAVVGGVATKLILPAGRQSPGPRCDALAN